jgi:hypothetical protein
VTCGELMLLLQCAPKNELGSMLQSVHCNVPTTYRGPSGGTARCFAEKTPSQNF